MGKEVKRIIGTLVTVSIIGLVTTVILNSSAIAVLKSEYTHIKNSLNRMEVKLGTTPKKK